jgi:hypothetical protein
VSCLGLGWRRVQAAIYGLAGAAAAAWLVQHLAEAPVSAAVVFGMAALAWVGGFGLALLLLDRAACTLAFDGQQWLAGGEPQRVDLMLQTGSFVLLRLRASHQSTRWLAVQRTEAGPAWHGLLVALHATPAVQGPLTQGRGS